MRGKCPQRRQQNLSRNSQEHREDIREPPGQEPSHDVEDPVGKENRQRLTVDDLGYSIERNSEAAVNTAKKDIENQEERDDESVSPGKKRMIELLCILKIPAESKRDCDEDSVDRLDHTQPESVSGVFSVPDRVNRPCRHGGFLLSIEHTIRT